MKHLRIGGSSCARTVACPAWLSRSADIPKQEAGPAAREGTMLHTCMENYYRDGIEFEDQVGVTEFEGLVFTQAMLVDLVTPAYEMTEATLDKYDIDVLYIEPFVEIVPDEVGGSIDMLCFSEDGKTMLVYDHKFGRINVEVEQNKQILFYTLAAITDAKIPEADLSKVEQFIGGICQPKVSHEAQLWEFDAATLKAFQGDLERAIKLSEAENPLARTGAHCKYCPAAPYCPEKIAQATGALEMTIETDADLAQAMDLVSQLEDWCKDVRNTTHKKLEQGHQVPGYKLVAKRATRTWSDPEAVADLIRKAKKITLAEGFDQKLRTPPQIEKLCKAKGIEFDRFEAYVDKKSSGTTLTTEDDKREAISTKVQVPKQLDLIMSGK